MKQDGMHSQSHAWQGSFHLLGQGTQVSGQKLSI